MHGLGQAQRALLGTIEVAIQTAGRTEEELQKKSDLPQLGTDPVSGGTGRDRARRARGRGWVSGCDE